MTEKIDTVLCAWIVDQEMLDLTKRSIDSLKQLNGINLIVVDNASPLGGGYLREVSDIYIRNQTNLGYAPAMNRGLKLCTSKYVAFAENDILVSSNCYDVAREIFEDDEIGSVHFRMNGYNEGIVLGNNTWDRGKERWCTISFAVWRNLAMNNQWLDENYIMANYEDWDILHRVRHMQHWKTAYTNKACYCHKDSSSQKKLDQSTRQQEAQQNREYFRKKWGNYPEFIWETLYLDQMLKPWRPFP